MHSPPSAWRLASPLRPRKPVLLTKSDVRIAGTAASIGAWMAGGGFVGSFVAGLAVPLVARVTGLSR